MRLVSRPTSIGLRIICCTSATPAPVTAGAANPRGASPLPGDGGFDKPAGAVAYTDIVDLFSGFKFDVCNLHNCTDNGGLDGAVEEADRSIRAGNRGELCS